MGAGATKARLVEDGVFLALPVELLLMSILMDTSL